MVALPFTNPGTQPVVTSPSLRITAQAAPGGGGLAGAADLAGDLLGGASGAADPWNTHLLSLQISLAIGDHVDHAVICLLDSEQTPAAALGDSLEIAYGPSADEETLIFTGIVSRIESSVSGYRRIMVTSPALQLAQTRRNSSFQEQSASDIIQALLAETEVSAGTIDSGEQYPFYAVSDRTSLLAHICELCRQQNWLCYSGGDGNLNAHALQSGEVARAFTYGVDIIDLTLRRQEAVSDGSKVVGSGAATSQGADAWCWLTKEPRAVAETGAATRVFPVPALRDVPTAQAHAGFLGFIEQSATQRIRLHTAAAPEVLCGRAFSVSGVPDNQANAHFVADRVMISFDRVHGYLSEIQGFSRDAAEQSLAGLAGGLL